jgi:hypothetical protein
MTTEGDGSFTIPGILPGSYSLYASIIPPRRPVVGRLSGEAVQDLLRPTGLGRTQLQMPESDLNGLTVSIEPGMALTGKIMDPGKLGIPIEDLFVSVVSREVLSNEVLPGKRLNTTGTFDFAFVPTPFRYWVVLSGLPEDTYVADIREGDTSILESGLEPGNASTRSVQIFLKNPGAVAEGIVRGQNGSGIPYTTVALIPEPKSRLNYSLYKSDSVMEKYEESGSAVTREDSVHARDIEVKFIPQE